MKLPENLFVESQVWYPRLNFICMLILMPKIISISKNYCHLINNINSKVDSLGFLMIKRKLLKHIKSSLDISSVCPLIFVVSGYVITRFNLQGAESNILISLGFTILIIATSIFIMFAIAHLCKQNWRSNPVSWKVKWAILSENFLLTSFLGRIEDVIGVLATLDASIYLIARVNSVTSLNLL